MLVWRPLEVQRGKWDELMSGSFGFSRVWALGIRYLKGLEASRSHGDWVSMGERSESCVGKREHPGGLRGCCAAARD